MNQKSNPFGLDTLRLTARERDEMRSALTSHMLAHPLPTPSPWVLSPFQRHALRPFAYTFALLLVVGAGTSVAAADALPGSMLYAVKVNVNEKVQSALARTPEEKAEFAVELTHRRLSEVELLAASSSLSQLEETAAGERIAEAAFKAQEAITELEARDSGAAEKVTAVLTATILKHSSILETLAASGNEDAGEFVDRARGQGKPAEETATTTEESEDRPQSKANTGGNRGAAAAAAAND
jgi:hypothetical protein